MVHPKLKRPKFKMASTCNTSHRPSLLTPQSSSRRIISDMGASNMELKYDARPHGNINISNYFSSSISRKEEKKVQVNSLNNDSPNTASMRVSQLLQNEAVHMKMISQNINELEVSTKKSTDISITLLKSDKSPKLTTKISPSTQPNPKKESKIIATLTPPLSYPPSLITTTVSHHSHSRVFGTRPFLNVNHVSFGNEYIYSNGCNIRFQSTMSRNHFILICYAFSKNEPRYHKIDLDDDSIKEIKYFSLGEDDDDNDDCSDSPPNNLNDIEHCISKNIIVLKVEANAKNNLSNFISSFESTVATTTNTQICCIVMELKSSTEITKERKHDLVQYHSRLRNLLNGKHSKLSAEESYQYYSKAFVLGSNDDSSLMKGTEDSIELYSEKEERHLQQEHLREELRELETLASEMAQMKVEASVAEVKGCSMEELGELEELRKQKEQWNDKARKQSDQWSEEVASLKREVAEYEVEFSSLKNQDITIRKLEGKISELERARDEEVTAAIRKVQEELAETEGRRASDALEREAVLERKLQSIELELKAERAGREVAHSHILQAEDGADQREAAWEAQRRILIDDSERSREALHHATTERDELRMKVASIDTPSSTMSPPPSSSGVLSTADILAERRAYEAEVDELSHSLSTLREELQTKNDHTISLQSSLNQVQQQRDSLTNDVSQLQVKLNNAPSPSLVDNMKRELRVLKRLEYNADEQADDDNDDEDDLQTVILARLRKIEADLLKERREKDDVENKLKEVQAQLGAAENMNDDAQLLISKLELDLHKAFQADPSNPNPNPATAPSDPNLLQNILDSQTTDTTTKTITTAPSSSPPDSANPPSDHTVATILIAQRDRLKSRCDALEAERDSFKKELQLQVTLSDSLRTDNTKLYEKLRFLQNFAANSKNKAHIATSSLMDRDVDLEALEQRYEASVDPFKQFNKTERLRKLKEMSHRERMVFYAAKTVLSNKQMRTALFIYVCTMHLLVFITTYHWAHELNCAGFDEEDMPHMHGGIPLQTPVTINCN